MQVWASAGYNKNSVDSGLDDEFVKQKVLQILLPSDSRVIYTDMAHIMSNNYGIIINFVQTVGPGQPPIVVSRVGMSKEHARSIIKILEAAVAPEEDQKPPKLLPPPSK